MFGSLLRLAALSIVIAGCRGGSSHGGDDDGNQQADAPKPVDARSIDAAIDAPPPAGGTHVRLMAGNLTSGNLQAYELPGEHIFQGLHPDIAMIQEFNVGDNAPATIRNFVDTTFGASFAFFR